MEFVVLVVLLGGISLIAWGVIAFIRALVSPSPNPQPARKSEDSDDLDGMNEGYYHDGPNGYSPMTSYPNSYYGRGGHQDSDEDEYH